MATYYVVAPLVIATDELGAKHYFYQGGPLPSSIGKDELDRLEAGGLIASNEAEVAEAFAAGSLTEPAAPVADGGKPDGRSSREKWAEYAKSNGATDDELKPVEEGGLSKADLTAKYGV